MALSSGLSRVIVLATGRGYRRGEYVVIPLAKGGAELRLSTDYARFSSPRTGEHELARNIAEDDTDRILAHAEGFAANHLAAEVAR